MILIAHVMGLPLEEMLLPAGQIGAGMTAGMLLTIAATLTRLLR
jgi:hypothetical protein